MCRGPDRVKHCGGGEIRSTKAIGGLASRCANRGGVATGGGGPSLEEGSPGGLCGTRASRVMPLGRVFSRLRGGTNLDSNSVGQVTGSRSGLTVAEQEVGGPGESVSGDGFVRRRRVLGSRKGSCIRLAPRRGTGVVEVRRRTGRTLRGNVGGAIVGGLLKRKRTSESGQGRSCRRGRGRLKHGLAGSRERALSGRLTRKGTCRVRGRGLTGTNGRAVVCTVKSTVLFVVGPLCFRVGSSVLGNFVRNMGICACGSTFSVQFNQIGRCM